jgi:hypothetical protein
MVAAAEGLSEYSCDLSGAYGQLKAGNKKFVWISMIFLDKNRESWFNITIMKQINRKKTNLWWWPEG